MTSNDVLLHGARDPERRRATRRTAMLANGTGATFVGDEVLARRLVSCLHPPWMCCRSAAVSSLDRCRNARREPLQGLTSARETQINSLEEANRSLLHCIDVERDDGTCHRAPRVDRDRRRAATRQACGRTVSSPSSMTSTTPDVGSHAVGRRPRPYRGFPQPEPARARMRLTRNPSLRRTPKPVVYPTASDQVIGPTSVI
jgi:hypothetical protein